MGWIKDIFDVVKDVFGGDDKEEDDDEDSTDTWDPFKGFTFKDALGPGAALGSGILSYAGQQTANAANASQAAQMMGFQERMSNTQYQRGVADMKAAGLNPMLAYSQGGASSPSGSQARIENAVTPGVSSAMQAAATVAQVSNLTAQTRKTEADTGYVESNTRLNETENQIRAAELPRTLYSAERAENELIIQRQEVRRLSALANREVETQNDRVQQARAERELAQAKAKLEAMELSRGSAYKSYYDTPVGKSEPYLKLGEGVFDSLGSALRSRSSRPLASPVKREKYINQFNPGR